MTYLVVLLFVSLLCGSNGFRRPSTVPRNSGRVNNGNNHRCREKVARDDHGLAGRSRLQLGERLLVDSTAAAAASTSRTSLHAKQHKFKNFEEVLATYHEEPLMVIFTAVNCGPCRLMKQELKQVSSMVGGKLQMFAVDTEKFPHIGR